MKRKNTPVTSSLSPEQPAIKFIKKLFNDYLDTTSAILQSHAFTEDAELELKEADKNLLEEIENLEIITNDFDSLIEQLDKLKANHDDSFDEDEVLKLVSEETIIAEAGKSAGLVIVKLQSIADTDKLIEFVNREIYPYNINNREALKV